MPIRKKYNISGFTLVELLVVISIIAILSVIGLTVFKNTQSSARDAKRQSDIKAISQALESHFVSDGSGIFCNGAGSVTASSFRYCPLYGAYFSNGSIPSDPAGNMYCLWSAQNSTDVIGAPPIAGWTTTCPSVSAPTARFWSTSYPPGPLPLGYMVKFLLCASLENNGTAKPFCISNTQGN